MRDSGRVGFAFFSSTGRVELTGRVSTANGRTSLQTNCLIEAENVVRIARHQLSELFKFEQISFGGSKQASIESLSPHAIIKVVM